MLNIRKHHRINKNLLEYNQNLKPAIRTNPHGWSHTDANRHI